MNKSGLKGPLPEVIGLLTELEVLDLSNNKLSSLPTAIGSMHRLKSIHLQNNRVEGLPDVSSLHCLETADFRNNKILRVPPSLKKLKNLRVLLLQGNPLCDRKVVCWGGVLVALLAQGCQVEGKPSVDDISFHETPLRLCDLRERDPHLPEDLPSMLSECRKLRLSLGEDAGAVNRSITVWREFCAPHLSVLGELKVALSGTHVDCSPLLSEKV